MKQMIMFAAALLAGGSVMAAAQGPDDSVATSPPAEPYQRVSELVALPDFIPGLGQLFVDPATLPAGPFLAYGHDGDLVSTIYMIPIDDLNPDTVFDELPVPGQTVDHTEIHYNAGHPGVEVPHAHIVLWHISAEEKTRVAE